ncbi:MAG: hypothetical protein BWY76_02140 [bacterium ADurb.Bin429]|nr:MAG: hypothetical protein BWY76_02140 [bacterium ADurb.Bin429]
MQIRPRQPAFGEERAVETGAGQRGVGEIRLQQHRLAQIQPREVRADGIAKAFGYPREIRGGIRQVLAAILGRVKRRQTAFFHAAEHR